MSNQKPNGKKHRVAADTRLVAIISIALPLFILGWVAIIQLGQYSLNRQVREEVTFTLLLAPGSTEAQAQTLITQLKAKPFIKEVQYISPQDAAAELEEELGENPEKVLGYNPLQPSVEVHLKSAYTHRDSLPKVDREIKALDGVDDLSYRQDMMQQVDGVLKRVSNGMLIATLVLLIIAVIQINNTTHLLIYTRRFLIRTMTLLGARKRLISRPFVLYSVGNGLWGGIVAVLLVALSLWILVKGRLETLQEFVPLMGLAVIAVGLPVLGMVLSYITSLFSTGKYIRMEGGKLILN